jgi:hypothetical protein
MLLEYVMVDDASGEIITSLGVDESLEGSLLDSETGLYLNSAGAWVGAATLVMGYDAGRERWTVVAPDTSLTDGRAYLFVTSGITSVDRASLPASIPMVYEATAEVAESLVIQVARYLAEQDIGTFDEAGAAGDIYVLHLPDEPDECIALYPTGGPRPGSVLPYDMVTIQALVRGAQDPRAALVRAQAIYDLMHGFRNDRLTDTGTWIIGCHAMQSSPNHIGRDEHGRHEYSINLELEIVNASRRA